MKKFLFEARIFVAMAWYSFVEMVKSIFGRK